MGKKLYIAIICDSIDTTLGGSFISAQRFARGLAERGHHIIWCTSKFIDASRKKDFDYAKIYEFPSIFSLGPQDVRLAYTRVSSLERIFENEDIDIVYNIHPTFIGLQAYRAAKKMCIPIINHSHIYAQLLVPGLPGFLQRWIKNIIARFYRKCDGIVFPTRFAQNDFVEYGFHNKSAIISNGVDTVLFHPGEKTSTDVFSIVCAGRLDPEKNVSVLIEAIRILKSQHRLDNKVRCTIVGSGCEENKLRDLVKGYDLGHVVHFTGKLDASHIIPLFQSASVYVHCSLYELESMTTLEAMACGCPLLIADSKHSAAKFFVKDNGYIFDPYDPRDLADKLHVLMVDTNILETLREKSIQEVATFSFEKSVEKLESFFLSFL